MAKHAYWRIRGLRGTGNAQFSKIEFRETIGGANVATGGTAFASTEFSSSYVAAYAFNENNADFWAAVGSVGQWIAYHFPTPVEPAEIAMRVGDTATSYWRFAAVDWSDDGVTWTNSGLFIPDQSPVTSWLVYDLLERGTGDAIEGQAYRYWRLRTLDWVSGGYQQIGEFRLLNGTTNLITSAGGSASADVAFSGFPASAAFDANFTTAWVDDGTSTVSHWLQWDFGANNAQIVTGYELAPRTSAPEQVPPAWALECSNDGTNWTVADYRTEQTGWTTEVYRAFDIEYNTARPVVRSRSSSVTVLDAVTSITLTRGATLVDDLLVAAVVGRSEITAPAGWALLRSVSFSTDTTTQYLNIYTKRATASEPTTYEFTQASAGRFNGYIISLYNPLNGLVYVDAHSGGVYNTSSAALSAPSITVAKDDSLLLLVPSSILSQPSPATANWSYSERITSLGLPAASDKRVDGATRYVEAGTHASRYVATINFTPGAATAYGMAVIAFNTGIAADFTFNSEIGSPPGAPYYDNLTDQTLTGAWGLRRLISTYTGPIVQVRRVYTGPGAGPVGGSTPIDLYADDNGELIEPITSEFYDYFVTRLYDQTGGDDLIQTTSASQPKIAWNAAPQGRPAIKFDGSDDFLKGETNGTTRPYMTARPFMAVLCGDATTSEAFATVAKIVDTAGSNPSPYARFGANISSAGWPSLETRVDGATVSPFNRITALTTSGAGWSGYLMSANSIFALPGLREAQALASARDVTYPRSTALYVGGNGAGAENIGLHISEIVMGQSSTLNFAAASNIINNVVTQRLWGAKRAYRIIATDDFGATGGECSFAEVAGYQIVGGDNVFAAANGAIAFANRRYSTAEDEFKAIDGNTATLYSAGQVGPTPTWGVVASEAGDIKQITIRARNDEFTNTTIKVFTVEQQQADGSWLQIGSFDLTTLGVTPGQLYTLNLQISADFTFDYELIPVSSGDIYADFTFNYAVQVGAGFSFDYAYTTTVDFSFDYAVSLGASFEFDNVIDIGAPFGFDYAVQLGAAFDFDSATQVGASFTFTNRIEGLVSVTFAFDYAVDLGSSFTFDYAYSVDAEFSFDYKYEIAAVFAGDYAIQLGASFGFDFRYVITANFAFDYGYELGVPFDFDYAVQIGVDFDFDFGFGFVRDFTFSYKLATVEIFADFSFSYLINTYALSSGFMLVPETPVAERWEYLTTSAVARDGSEQRAALRRNPRVSVDYNFVVTTEAERRVMFDLLYQKIRGAFLVPLYAYGVQISAPVAQGQKVVSYNAARTDIRAGDYVYYMTPDGETGSFEIAQIVGTNSLTLAFGAGFALPAGSWIMPALEMTAAVGAGLSMRALGGSVAVAFDALDNRRPLPRPGSTATVQTFDGFPVVTQRHSADASITDQFDGGLISLDEAVDVRRALFSPQSSVFVGGARSYRVKRNSEALDYWRDLLDMTKGKRSPFLISTYRNDLEPGANVAGDELNVIGREYLDKFESNAFKRLEIEAAGVVSWHKVTGVSTIAGGLRLTLDTPYANADIGRVSFLNLVRLNSDTINVTHEQLDTVINLSVRSVDA